MSLDKAIAAGKEHRKPYRGAAALVCSCRNHGSCTWCQSNRTIGNTRRRPADEHKQLEESCAEITGLSESDGAKA